MVPFLRMFGCPAGYGPMETAAGGVPGSDLHQRGQHAVENIGDLQQPGGKGSVA